MSNKNYRKITVGDNFSSCIAYVKGAKYLGRTVKVTDIILDESGDNYEIYVSRDGEDTQVLWKSISKNQVLEIEYDLNFD